MQLFGRRHAEAPRVNAMAMDGYRVALPERGFQLSPRFGSAGSLEAPDDLLAILAGLSSSSVTRRDALSIPTILRARNKIASTIATLPINVHDRTFAIDERNTVVTDPNPVVEPGYIYSMTAEDLLFDAVSYWRVLRFGADGFPVEAMRVDLRSVSQHAILGMPSEVLSEDLQFSPRDPIFIDGMQVSPREIIRFISLNPPLRKHAARAIRSLLLLDKVAETYANDPMPLGYFTDREDADPLDDDEVTDVLNQWRTARKDRAWGYVPNSLEANTLQWDAEKLQLNSARQHAVLEVIRATGLDPVDVGVDVTTSHTYQNAEERRMAQLDVLMPYMVAIEQRLSMNDVLPRGLHARFDTSGFLRTDFKSRMGAFRIAKEIGAMTDDEIRRAEHRPVLTAAQKAAMKPVVPPQLAPEQSNGNGSSNGNGRVPVEVDS